MAPENLEKKELALKNLSDNKNIVIRVADKGGGVVLQNFEDYDGEARKILNSMRR